MSDNTIEQVASYGIGRNMGEQLLAQPIENLDKELVIAGLSDVLNELESRFPVSEIHLAFAELNKKRQAEEAEKAKKLAAEGEAFLAENAKNDDVHVTESGLQYTILEKGDGDKPAASSTVRTHYHGTLIDGTVFDSSYDRGTPAEFPVNGVIAGWTEALQMMEVGSKWRLFIPYNLAYGERGAGGAIGPYAALVFDVELLAIVS